MKVIIPIVINDTTLTSSNVPENDYAAWSSVTNYVIGDFVIVTTPNVHKIYQALTNNLNKYPPSYLTGATPDWAEISATNRWKMFDKKAQSATSKATSIIVEITAGVIVNSLAAVNIAGDAANVTVTDPTDGIVYDHDVDLLDLSSVYDFWTWFFSPLANLTNFTLTDLPAFPAATVKLTVEKTTGNAEIGEAVLGSTFECGSTEYPIRIGIEDYSRKDIDDDGNAVITQGRYRNYMDIESLLQTNLVNGIKNVLTGLRGTPVMYIGAEDVTESIIYGFYQDFEITEDNLNTSKLSMEVVELI